MSASSPASSDPLLVAIAHVTVYLALAALVVWIMVFLVRLRRLRRARREAEAEEKLTGLVLDSLSGYQGKDSSAALVAVPSWQKPILLRVLQSLAEQTQGRDRTQLIGLMRDAGFLAAAQADLQSFNLAARRSACLVLAYFDDNATITSLRIALLDADPGVRIISARALLQKDKVPSLTQLLWQLNFSIDDPPLLMAELLSHLPGSLYGQAAGMLREQLPPEWLRVVAIALGRKQAPDAFEAIAELRKSPSARLRAAAWVALKELGDPLAGEIVAEGLADPEPDVRRAAAACAGALGGETVLPQLAALLGEADWWVRYDAAAALSSHGPAGRELLRRHTAQCSPDDPAWQAEHENAREASHAG